MAARCFSNGSGLENFQEKHHSWNFQISDFTLFMIAKDHMILLVLYKADVFNKYRFPWMTLRTRLSKFEKYILFQCNLITSFLMSKQKLRYLKLFLMGDFHLTILNFAHVTCKLHQCNFLQVSFIWVASIVAEEYTWILFSLKKRFKILKRLKNYLEWPGCQCYLNFSRRGCGRRGNSTESAHWFWRKSCKYEKFTRNGFQWMTTCDSL